MRIKLTIEYDGTTYAGWQRQDNVMSVQQAIEEALFAVFQQDIALTVAGRTDAGVHAMGQVAHCDIDNMKTLTPDTLPKAINFHLVDHPIAVLHAEEVSEEFHARFGAKNKIYRYTILNRQAKPALGIDRVWHVRQPLDVDAMNAAAQAWLGHHDFSSFRDSECQAKTPMRTLDRLEAKREGEYVIVEAEAQSFLHHQVRNMAGTLVEFGSGKRPVNDAGAVLAARNRSAAGVTAPPQGLVLVRIHYQMPPSRVRSE